MPKELRITATLAKRLTDWTGDARLYELNRAVHYGDGTATTKWVVVSATMAYSGPETYIFPSDDAGEKILDWGEMEGSFRGALDHAAAIKRAGWELA